jgi:arylsulfatase A-like enzyme
MQVNNRRQFLQLGGVGTAALAAPKNFIGSPNSDRQPNVLFIMCDDLNDTIAGMGGHPQARTPNINRLMDQGVQFTNAHCTAPLCISSRASTWTGLYPHNLGLYGNDRGWSRNPVFQQSVTLFENFIQNGYDVFGTGKVFHGSNVPIFSSIGAKGIGIDTNYGPYAYNGKEKCGHSSVRRSYGSWHNEGFAPLSDVPEFGPRPEAGIPGYRGWVHRDDTPFQYVSESDRDLLPDEESARFAVDCLRSHHDNPFFLATGFVKPHRPLYAPRKYFDMFPLNTIQLPPYLENDLVDVPSNPNDVYNSSHSQWVTINNPSSILKWLIPN